MDDNAAMEIGRRNSGMHSDIIVEKPEDVASRGDTPDLEKNMSDNEEEEAAAPESPSPILTKTQSGKIKDEAFRVRFEDGDPNNPKNWSNTYKACITLLLGFLA
jgi:DHA1 family multidrug resistance protein-like MFS transporter